MRIVIVGNGSFGKAMSHVLQKNSSNIHIAKRGDPIQADVVVLCVPTNALQVILPKIHFLSDTKIIVNTSKGIEENSHHFPYQIVDDYFGEKVSYFSLMGPGFASEILNDSPTFVNLGYHHQSEYTEKIKALFQTDAFRVRMVPEVESIEIASAMKNIYAIGCGLADGLGYGDNAKVTLLTIAIDEMQHYFAGFTKEFCLDATAGMIGDLILTCMSKESRNFQFGKHLVTHTTKEALDEIKSTVEGYTSIRSLPYVQKKSHHTLVFADFIAQIIEKDETEIREQFARFLKQI